MSNMQENKEEPSLGWALWVKVWRMRQRCLSRAEGEGSSKAGEGPEEDTPSGGLEGQRKSSIGSSAG